MNKKAFPFAIILVAAFMDFFMRRAGESRGAMHNKNAVVSLLLRNAARAFCLLLLPLLLCSPALAQVRPELSQADALVKAGKPAEAYALLAPLEDKYAGDPQFDYLLGIAALDSGKADKATLAFERVLAVSPNFAGARLDMARAYFQLGDFPRAKAEFEAVQLQGPPPAAQATIQRYLELIAQREKAQRTRFTAFAEFTLGRDDNVNNSTSTALVGIPALGNVQFTLASTNVQRADNYGLFYTGADITHEIQPGIAVFGGVAGRYRSNQSEDLFDYKSVDGRGGVLVTVGDFAVRGTLSGERYYVDHNANRNLLGLGADVRYSLDPANIISGVAQYLRFRFEQQALTIENFEQNLFGGGWTRLFADGRSSFSLNLYGGHENAANFRADGDKDIRGLRVGGNYSLREDLDLFGSAGGQRGDYKQQNATFLTTREDKLRDAVAGLNWRFTNDWSLRPQVLYIRNNSNIAIYAYKRWDYSATVRYEFK